MRTLLLHAKSVEPTDLVGIRDRVASGLSRIFPGAEPIMLFAGDEVIRYGSGGWKAWEYHAGEGRRVGGAPSYDLLVCIPIFGLTIGKVTGAIVDRALTVGRPVWTIEKSGDRILLKKVRGITKRNGGSWREYADLIC